MTVFETLLLESVSTWLALNNVHYVWLTANDQQNTFTLLADHENCIRLAALFARQGGSILDERKSKQARYYVLECQPPEVIDDAVPRVQDPGDQER